MNISQWSEQWEIHYIPFGIWCCKQLNFVIISAVASVHSPLSTPLFIDILLLSPPSLMKCAYCKGTVRVEVPDPIDIICCFLVVWLNPFIRPLCVHNFLISEVRINSKKINHSVCVLIFLGNKRGNTLMLSL